MKIPLRPLAACLAVLSAAAFTRADDSVAAVIAKARAHLGSEETLAKVQAVRYIGVIEPAAGSPKDAVPVRLDVIFQSPYRMLQRVISAKGTEVTALDDWSGWAMSLGLKNEPLAGGRLRADPVKRLRASVRENLSFYAGLELAGGHIEDGGTVTLNGKPARKLIFWHDSQLRFTRWFDPATGQLIQTETDDGATITEEGELSDGSVRFPKKIITTTKGKDGKASSSSIVFERIILNEPLDAKAFDMPRPSASSAAPAAPKPAAGSGPPVLPALPTLPKATPTPSSSNLGLPPTPPK